MNPVKQRCKDHLMYLKIIDCQIGLQHNLSHPEVLDLFALLGYHRQQNQFHCLSRATNFFADQEKYLIHYCFEDLLT